MKIKCDSCHKQYSLDVEKAKKLKKSSLDCPECGALITFTFFDETVDTCSTSGEELKKEILKKVKALPPMPQVLMKAKKIVDDPYKGAKELADVLETDQAMTTRVLKLSNSAYYSPTTPVSSVKQACILLGEESLLMLITLVCTSKLMGSRLKGYDISSVDMFRHSLKVALGSQKIADKIKPELSADAYSAGLIHDMGKLIMDPFVAERKEDFHTHLKKHELELLETERKLFGFDHTDIGYDYCTNWNIPDIQAQAVKEHHKPDPASENILPVILHIADIMANFPIEDLTDEEINELIDGSILKVAGFSTEEIRMFAVDVTESVNQITESLVM